jgi:phosphate transport system substrate-binding protein
MYIIRSKNGIAKWMYIIIIIILITIIGAGLYTFSNSSNTKPPTTSSMTTSSTQITFTQSVTIKAGGSTFINPQVQKWIVDFKDKYPSISIFYDSVGSGTGVSRFLEGIYDIGASDVPLPTEQWNQAVQKYNAIITIPDIVGAVGIIYNIPGFNPSINGPLNMTAGILAQIYTGKIQYWDDPQIVAINPGFKFPHEKIIAVHRSDGSGTTFVFTLYLQKAAKDKWSIGSGFTVQWPVDQLGNGLGGKGNEGVTAYVGQNPYSIGYVEYQYAVLSKLQTAQLKNHDGYFVALQKIAYYQH